MRHKLRIAEMALEQEGGGIRLILVTNINATAGVIIR
ncbi:MAG: hypothetical protein JWR22_2519 [Herminiimonas sp.]|nr:hypothetical protein [Herminiimonas sp.]